MYKKIFVFLSAFIFLLHHSQISGLINYTENDGLNSSYTYYVRQDHNGFIWIGSDNGLFRFDGKEFKQYGKKEGLKNIDIISCEPLPNGEIFILPFLNDFTYLKNGKIINSNINKYLRNQFLSTTPSINRDGNKLYLYRTHNPQSIFIYESGKVKKQPIFMDYKKRSFSAIKFDFRTGILYLKNDEKDEISAYSLITREEKVLKVDKGVPVCVKNNFFVFHNKRKINIYKLSGPYHIQKIYSYNIQENIFHATIDKNNKLWIGLENGGLLYFNQSLPENKKILASPIKILNDYVINSVLVDKDDNIWFSSRNNGIFFITKAFFTNQINLPVKYNPQYIKAIAKDEEKIILGYNKSSGAIIDKNGKIKEFTLDKFNKIENKSVYVKNNIFIFGLSNKVIIYDILQNKNIRLEYGLKNIVPYTGNSVLFCTVNSLTVYNIKNKSTSNILDERVYTALPYTEDSLFVGNFSDLYKVNVNTKNKTLFLEGYYFTDLKKLRDNIYIGATNLHGIILFNNKGVLKIVTENDGLINDQVKKIEVENKNIFWASTNSGISRIEVKKNQIRINNFTQTDGLPSNAVAGCVIKNDTIFIGTSKGLGIFSIEQLLTQEKFINKKVIINSVEIGNTEYVNPNKELPGHADNNIVFNLSFLDYASQGKISYKYKIEGLNYEWQVSNSSKIVLNSVPPGKYTFKVFGLGYNGKQSYTFSYLSFEIKPRFWQTWWFALLTIIITITVLLLILNLYFQKRRNKKLEALYYEKKIAELELQAIKAQINPHFIYNCLNSIQFLLYKKDYPEAENYLDIFSLMIRKTLHYSEKTFMPVKEEAAYLSLYLDMEKLRLKDRFDYQIIISEKVNENWAIPSLLIQPFVENAIKHGISGLKDRKGNIKVSLDHIDHSLCITIEDNGAGIGNQSESIAKASSFGVKLSQKRIETFKQLFETNITLEINNLPDQQGTQIKLHITNHENQNTSMHY